MVRQNVNAWVKWTSQIKRQPEHWAQHVLSDTERSACLAAVWWENNYVDYKYYEEHLKQHKYSQEKRLEDEEKVITLVL